MKAALFALALSVTPAVAADSFYDLYAQGHYDDAMRAGEAAGSAQGFAIAARAVLADAAMRPAPCLDCLKRAEAYARKAVAADPKLVDGHVWLAATLGLEARVTGILKARLANVPAQAKAELDAALKDDPRDPYALSAMGGWNIEIVHAGGDHLGNWLYGASAQAGLEYFDRAVKAAPANVAVRYQIALSLAGYDPERFASAIRENLEAAVRAAPQTAYEKFIQARARELLALTGDEDTFDAKIRLFQGYP